MILGVDVGNFATKTSERVNFISKCSKVGNILNNSIVLKHNEGTFYIEEGSFDTEYQKIKKTSYMNFLRAAIALSTDDFRNKIVVGLPLSQYKQDKENLKQLILSNQLNHVEINGVDKKINIEDVEVYAEGVATIIDTNFQGLIIDIGGRTTDVALIENKNGIKKINNPFSMPIGTLNLYGDFIKAINSKYSLDLKSDDVERILENGLKIDGEIVETRFAIEVFKEYVEKLVQDLQIEYSLKTLDVLVTGGGAQLLYKPLKKRIVQTEISNNPVFSNALGYKRVGEQIWLHN